VLAGDLAAGEHEVAFRVPEEGDREREEREKRAVAVCEKRKRTTTTRRRKTRKSENGKKKNSLGPIHLPSTTTSLVIT
jgi:hypothetical protein